MTRPSAIVIGSVLVAACGGPGGGAIGNHPAAHETLAAELARDIGAGGSVAIIGGDKGVRAVSSDGQRQRILAPEAASWVIVDARSNVVWFGSPDFTAIRAIDLDRADAIEPVVETVVTAVPTPEGVAMVGAVYYGVVYPDPDPKMSPGEAFAMGTAYSLGSSLAHAHVDLVIDQAPHLIASSGYVDRKDWEDKAARATVVGRSFLSTLPPRKQPPDRLPSPQDVRVDGIDPSGCETPADCGTARTIPGTPYADVLVGLVTGDITHPTFQLYDNRVKALVTAEWATWLADAWVAPDVSGFVANGVVVRFDTGPLPATPAGQSLGGGWLGGGIHY